ncbi:MULTISPECIES: hypothetical protein [unclassified Mesorhizobium]|uniref:hypothetical protein n=1 Tax=unclassified Mesorhizobium TaxID=325217 RepID=UPI000FCC2B3B|nr:MULTISPECIES: hypothetical protein [unclassified Mesorhizobium]TGP26819.1 hypothetical protein EN874_003915 [Mesorhizobium sp. M1D.F.Ca.ET.231.01.1.1]TGP38776.1 hypothetical protein EN877_03915 [Mesorhizobium sp. M1D.F.Ca.ET.234.01.1.1]TGS50985.1 hypothetical protein EN827_03915 [Mesorhizobium sp. M1D.F.Ca.ET.184.01.1.1]TGS66869.1 hypothetical protein EN826_003915 [Mesorhizobium sp. M1D.F.Ca.ET.183.01.1.1]
MKKQLASFRDFLATGNLGPVAPDMALKDIAATLGPPDGWNVDDDHPVPVYWFFGNLEISFDSAAPYQMNWFQIEGATQLRGKSATLTGRLKLSLDGFCGETKPSEFLSAGLWDSRQATVYYAALRDDILLNICTGCVQIHFQVDTSFIGDREAIEYLGESTLSRLVRDVDSRTKVDSIYSYPQAATEEMPGALNWRSLSGQDYLDLLP